MSILRIGTHEFRGTATEHEGMRQIVIDIPREVDGGNWPSVTSERVWAKPLPGSRFKIDNVPFFAKGISLGDIVTVESGDDARDVCLRFGQVVERGGHSTYRVMVSPGLDPDRHNAYHKLLTALREFGTIIEIGKADFFAVDVPPSVDCSAIYDILQAGEDERIWDFEEGDHQNNDDESKPSKQSHG